MRKIYFIVLISFFCLAGCQQEIIEQAVIDADYAVELRSRGEPSPGRQPSTPPIPANVIASGEARNLPDPRMEIRGIPVWIYLPEGVVASDKRYLSAYPAANGIGSVALSSDPDHIRTRWVLEEIPGLDPLRDGGWVGNSHRLRSMYTGNDAGFIMSPPVIVPNGQLTREFATITPTFERNKRFHFSSNPIDTYSMDISDPFISRERFSSDRFRITYSLRNLEENGRGMSGRTGDLRAVGYGNNDVIIRPMPVTSGRDDITFPHDDYFGHWVINPVETFDLIDMKYDFLPNSNSFTATPRSIRVIRINNDSDIPSNETISVAETVTSQSTFSTTDNVSTSIAVNSNVEIKIPYIAESGINTTVTHNNGWSFTNGGTQTRSEVFTISRTLQVPPRTRLIVELVAISYNMNITYIATLRGRTTGRIIRLTGAWESVLVQEDDINIYHPDGRAYTNNEVQRLNIREI